jgi:hypothetical protein
VAGQKNDKPVRTQQPNQHHFMQAATSVTANINDVQHLATSNIENGFKPIILSQRMPTLVMTPTNTGITAIISSPPSSSSNDISHHQLLDNQNKEISLASMLKVEINSGEEHDKVETEIPTNTIYVPQDVASLSTMNQFGQKTKRYKCEMCPYETDSKSQFQYHSSFHKPSRNESYQCKYCSYNVSKRHLLNQHMKMHAASGINLSEDLITDMQASSESTNIEQLTIANEKFIHFCSMCPARYLSLREILNHVKLHETCAAHKCDFCSFSSSDDSNVKAHSVVHKSYYQEKTKEFMAKYKQANEYPNPDLMVLKHGGIDDSGDNDDVWVVKTSSNEAKSETPLPTDENKINERCLYCPFQATSLDVLKNHLQYHYAISNQYHPHKCDHCDFSIDNVDKLREHNELHFSFLRSDNKNLGIFTSFCGLELNAIKMNPQNSNDANNNVNGENIIFKEKDVKVDSDSDSERKEKVIIDV